MTNQKLPKLLRKKRERKRKEASFSEKNVIFHFKQFGGPFPLKCYRKVQDIHLKVTHLLNIRPQKRNKKLHVSFKNLSFGLEIF